jgi:membrane-associated phospholipid phosphatase
MIWHHPGFPSILVTYEVSNDLFFSGHTAIAVYGAIELARLGRSWLVVPAIVIVLYEVISVILLRAHYTMDVFTGIIAALYVSGIAKQLAPPCDRVLTEIFRRTRREIRNPEPSPSQL